jgi:uncharacterized protein (TIGR03437 family)
VARILTLLLLLVAARPLSAQVPPIMVRPGLTVLPVFFVPSDEADPTAIQQTTLMRHIYWAQENYLTMLSSRATFQIGSDRPQVYRGKNTSAYYRGQPDQSLTYVEEWLNGNGFTRFNCPYSLLIFFMSPKTRYPYPAGGRPINGWLNEGGGFAIFSSQDLDQFNFQSTLRHELGHTFGLVHADSNGYDMATNPSLMSYNTAHNTNFFRDSPTPGILIPEDLRSLGQNKLAFPFYSFTSADVPAGYKINPLVIVLLAPEIINEPNYTNPNQYFSANTVTQTVREMGTAVMTASFWTNGGGAPTGFRPSSYQWQFNNLPIPGATAATLVINAATKADAGVYRLLATSGTTSVLSNNLNLTVNPLVVPSSASISPANVNLASGGEGTFDIHVVPSNASWTAVSSADWLTVLSGLSGTGDWTLMFAAATNPSTTSRSAQISIAGATLTVTQRATFSPAPPLVTLLAPSTLRRGRTGTLTISGQNLQAAQLSVAAASGITLSGVQSSANEISATAAVSPDTAPGSFPLTITTAAGSAAINLFVVPDPSLPVITAVVNGASFGQSLAPSTFFSVFGSNLGVVESAQSSSTTALGGATLSVCGTPVILNYNSGDGQINALMPAETAGHATCPVVATVNGVRSPTFTVKINPQALGIFQFSLAGGQLPVATHADYSVIGPATSGLSPARAGETIIIWCTGWNPGAAKPSVTIGGSAAEVKYYGPSGGFAGLCQINAVVPGATVSGPNRLTVDSLGPFPLWIN